MADQNNPLGVAQQPTVALRETIKEGVRLINVAFGELAAGASRYCPRHERDKFEANFYAPAREWLNAANAALAAQAPAAPVEVSDASYCPYCDLEHELHEDAQGFHHIVKGERVE